MRFWDTQSGVVRLDGIDVRQLNVEDLRHSIALVSQQITLFAGSIRDNIAYGNRHATIEEVTAAARVAEAHEFIKALPGGYDSLIGFGGLTLSGGQRQRLAIARAVLSNRPLLLFDEATSSLDHPTEAALQRSLEVATRGRTTVIVAHRLSMVRHADIIYAIDDGAIREQGRHDELIKADGIYASMWRVQTGERHGPAPTAA
jgi:ATP-binding cassette subfamily B protein